ncbi:hypothetical protein AVEN_187908-1 [Araneus ventricosus]|uniref:Reverse transcriptase domain-containing protein n=1 Tax=Araneus ventricosus TaxID=182803 RepID=A0A4Y2CUK9_ARAVE|nr:hypothetical protein AVEN_187908-1 [Araneus ventricosus]
MVEIRIRNTCTKTTDPYGRPYKVVLKNKHPPAELFKQLGNPSNGDTKSFTLKILQELYPPSHPPVTPPNCFPLTQEPQITKNEIKRILKKAPTKKAPGFDAIDYNVLKEVNNSFPEILHTFYNKCYQLHCFPEPLKKRIIVLLRKDGKEVDKIKSYRPVTLLPTIGKVLEQILLRRLNHTLKKKNILHHNQIGFREGRSTDDAIHQLVERIQDAKNKKLHTMRTHRSKAKSYCSSSPHEIPTLDCHHQLKVSTEKSTTILISRLVSGNRVKWDNQIIKRSTSLKYLGVIIDNKLNWVDHLINMKTKLTHFHQKITRIAGTNWGLNKDLRRRLYKTVAEWMILHGDEAWAYPLSARQLKAIEFNSEEVSA